MKRSSRRGRFPLVPGGAAALTLACTCRALGDLGGFANEMQELANEFEEHTPAFRHRNDGRHRRRVPSRAGRLGPGPLLLGLERSRQQRVRQPAMGGQPGDGRAGHARGGGLETAWASLSSDTEEWLELTYDVPLWASNVNIVQTYNPNQVVRVELQDLEGQYQVVFEGEPSQQSRCPFTLEIIVQEPEFAAQKVVVVTDQSILGLGGNEIDAVELIGDIGD